MTQEQRDKLSSALKGRKAWNKGISVDCGGRKFKKGDKAHLGHKHSKESRLKMSLKLKGKKAWNKGLGNKTSLNERARDSKEFEIWRELVFERDNWTCQKCGIRGFEIHPHHILNFSDNKELRFNINNGITLCRECHYKFHIAFGFDNNNQEQIDEFINRASVLFGTQLQASGE